MKMSLNISLSMHNPKEILVDSVFTTCCLIVSLSMLFLAGQSVINTSLHFSAQVHLNLNPP